MRASDMAQWEPVIAVVIIAIALALDWALWRRHTKAAERELDRLARDAARRAATRRGRGGA